MKEEVSRRIAVRSLQGGRTEQLVEARPDELPALARRLDVPSVAALRCRFVLEAPGRDGIVLADGMLEAEVERICVVSLDPFPQAVAERFAVRFVPGAAAAGAEGADEAEAIGPLDPDEIDEVPYANGVIDLGEAAVEQLALCLDPYPRRPGVETDGATATGEGEPVGEEGGAGRPNPFALLGALKATRH